MQSIVVGGAGHVRFSLSSVVGGGFRYRARSIRRAVTAADTTAKRVAIAAARE